MIFSFSLFLQFGSVAVGICVFVGGLKLFIAGGREGGSRKENKLSRTRKDLIHCLPILLPLSKSKKYI